MPIVSVVVLGTAAAARGVVAVIIRGNLLVGAARLVGGVVLILVERRLRA
jgi:hypothetical protein